MDIEQSAGIAAHESWRQNTHESGQNNQLGSRPLELLDQYRFEGFSALKITVIDHRGGNTGLRGTLQTIGVGAIRYHQGYLARKPTAGRPIYKGL